MPTVLVRVFQGREDDNHKHTHQDESHATHDQLVLDHLLGEVVQVLLGPLQHPLGVLHFVRHPV